MGIGELIDRLRKLNEITIDGIVYVEKIDLDYLIGEQVNNSKYFNVGDRVRVIAPHNNASIFNRSKSFPDFKSINGVYQFDNWQEIIFTIIDTYKPCEFTSSPNTYGTYPLSYEDVFVGYVYCDALELA